MEKNAKYISVAATGIGVRIYPGTEVEKFAHSSGFLKNDFSWASPFHDRDLESLGNDPVVPVLIQRQFGWHEFRKIEFRLAQFWLKNPHAALSVLWSQIKLGRSRVLIRLVRRFIEVHFLKRNSSRF
jgi:hypothetical protein